VRVQRPGKRAAAAVRGAALGALLVGGAVGALAGVAASTLHHGDEAPCVPDDKEFEAAIDRLMEPERFSEAERIVAKAAPQLQKVLGAALAEGGWFGESHEKETLKAATAPDPDERIASVRALLAEEARMGMMVGVAVGWALKEELSENSESGGES